MYYVYLEKYVLCLFREICIMFIWKMDQRKVGRYAKLHTVGSHLFQV